MCGNGKKSVCHRANLSSDAFAKVSKFYFNFYLTYIDYIPRPDQVGYQNGYYVPDMMATTLNLNDMVAASQKVLRAIIRIEDEDE